MALEGLIEEFHLSELIQVLANGGKTCLINLKTPYGDGMIYLREGKITHASDGILEGEDAFNSFLWWRAGSFEIISDEYPEKTTIRSSTHALIIEGNRILDEWTALREEMPDLDYDSVITSTGGSREISPSQLPSQGSDLLKNLAQPKTFKQLIKQSSLQELEMGRLINALQKQGFVTLQHQKHSDLSLLFKRMADMIFEEYAYSATLMQLKSFEQHLSQQIQQNQWPFEFKNYKMILSKTMIHEDHLAQIYGSFLREEMNYLVRVASKELLNEILAKIKGHLSDREKTEVQKLSISL